MKTPPWWYDLNTKPPAGALFLSKIYPRLKTSYEKLSSYGKKPKKWSGITLSVGNLVMGGAGKTPITQMLAKWFQEQKISVAVISRGYKGREKGPLSVKADHHPKDVGEEALLLAQRAPTWIGRNRQEILPLLEVLPPEKKPRVLLLDDGHQEKSLIKDLRLLVFDSQQGIGNGLMFPAGPLKQTLKEGLDTAQGILLVHPTPLTPLQTQEQLQTFLDPKLFSALQCKSAIFSAYPTFSCSLNKAHRVLGFAGLGFPQKFERTLRNLFQEVCGFIPFPDHFFYTQTQEKWLQKKAKEYEAHLVTTEKDWIKLSPEMQKITQVVYQTHHMTAENEVILKHLLKNLENFSS